jgi:hypothetical protein
MDWLSFVTFFMPLNVNDTDVEDRKPGRDGCQSKSIEEDQSLVMKILEGLRIENPVAVPLETASVILRLVSVKRPAKGLRAFRRIGSEGLWSDSPSVNIFSCMDQLVIVTKLSQGL